MSQTDWEDERAADIHDRMLRHGEMHRDVSGEWVGDWFFPFAGVERDGQDSARAVDAGDWAGVVEGVPGSAGCGHDAGVPCAGRHGSVSSGQGRDCAASSPRRWRDIFWRIIRRKRGG